jgi:hypothetical protein
MGLVAPQKYRAIHRLGSADDINQLPAVVQPRLRAWLGTLIDHDLVLVVDSAGTIVYSQPGQNSSDPELSMAAVSRAHAIVEFMRGRTALMPAGAMRLLGGAPSMRHHGVAETVFLINIRDRLNLVAAIPIGEASAGPSPFVLTVRTVDQICSPASANAATRRPADGRP